MYMECFVLYKLVCLYLYVRCTMRKCVYYIFLLCDEIKFQALLFWLEYFLL